MAGLISTPHAGEQFAAISQLRWRIFVHSLRTLPGRLEVVSWILVGLGYAILGILGTFGLGVAAWFLVSRGRLEWLALPIWGIFLAWQLFPVMATAFSENFDASNFLRFPLRYRSYFLIRIVYGALDPTTLIGILWLLGLTSGIGIAAPRLLPWTALVLATFAVLNILLGRVIFSWIERWLARRKSREIIGIVFFLFVICFQFIGPVLGHYRSRRLHPAMPHVMAELLPAENLLPPGLASSALARAAQGDFAIALGDFALLCGYAAVFLRLLDVRMRAQFRGENLSEVVAPTVLPKAKRAMRLGWTMPGLSGALAAIVEKEFRYLSRSGPMLFSFAMPIVILLIFRVGGPAGQMRNSRVHMSFLDFAFPFGAAYAMLVLSNLTYNSFGADGAGIQFFFVSPVRFREVMLAKNLTHAAVLALELLLVWVAVCLMFHPPAIGVALATLAGALFAALVNFVAGNLMSLYAPKKFDFAVLGKQRAAGITVLASMTVQALVFGLVGFTLFATSFHGRIWLATVLLLALASAAFLGYSAVLNRIDRIAISRRESIVAALCRA
jgi:ABC-2 type transport system permease protein